MALKIVKPSQTYTEASYILDDDILILEQNKGVKKVKFKIIDGRYLKPTNVIDSLTESVSNKPLSAKQGKILNEKINQITGGGSGGGASITATSLNVSGKSELQNVVMSGELDVGNDATVNGNITGGGSLTIGNITASGTITGDKVYGAYWNDYADAIECDEDPIPGFAYVIKNNKVVRSSKSCEAGVLGICSDTFSYLAGHKENRKELPLAVSGFVLAYVDNVYNNGTVLTTGKDGKLTKMNFLQKLFHPERIVGIFFKEEKEEKIKNINIDGRHWIKVK